ETEIGVFVERSTTGVLVYDINEQHVEVAHILTADGLTVPSSARQNVIDSIASIASTLTVQSDIGGESVHADIVEVDSRLHIHLQPMNDGLLIEVFIQPFRDGGPVYKPAEGGNNVLAEIEGKQLQTCRDFTLEKKYFKKLKSKCPELYKTKIPKWQMDEPEMALEALLQLQALDDFAVLEWPKGKKIKLNKEIELSEVQFSIRKEKDWFALEGDDITLDEDNVLKMQKLLQLVNGAKGRFLKLEDGQFIALTTELRQRLEDFSGLGEAHGQKLRFHPLAAPALDEMTKGMTLHTTTAWKNQLKNLSEMSNLVTDIPSTLQGTLRDYQLEGYQWMCRLAHWGAGACLADDMGLGKTIQALALILARAQDGATLILAPTSVCINWLEEAERFAPRLKVQHFGSAGSRQKMLDEAGAFDLIVCSYGLLQSEGERLSQKHWRTVVADEAQAIKNMHTKRSKAAMALQADFKLITTGTPIENHLGELWNLFNFINPGLFGSLKKFNEKYAVAIENNHDYATQQRLKKLLRPFILRRLKKDVLKELPPKTEITLHVEQSGEEKSMYEALRRTAVQTMERLKAEENPQGQQHLQVLAEIMKLRRACCNPSLVIKDSTMVSTKLAAFEELVDELLEGGHKVLVFSQFIGHLAIIKHKLDEKGIVYQYLDGATSLAKRKKAVNSFQAGEGDLFLISLKAGGSGLNLTAADYVIHMDPWWNPAVEDQASDRAHRMGQTRAVTIYRLVAKDTIEDKIVELHKHKRDLANNLLEGGDVSGKMSVKDIVNLIQDIDD
ncbi:MAG: DEAD/DEAH box helicase, partial [Methylococcales bacterium]|nr:DEAD/DEAH box helicase [Methylococcales bacterium]